MARKKMEVAEGLEDWKHLKEVLHQLFNHMKEIVEFLHV